MLRKWETVNLLRTKMASWHESKEFKELVSLVCLRAEPVSSLLLELSQEELGWDRLHDLKVSLKRSVERAGWTGQIFLWATGLIAGASVETAFNIPMGSSPPIDLLVVVIANDVRI